MVIEKHCGAMVFDGYIIRGAIPSFTNDMVIEKHCGAMIFGG
jgi:hypothetical protein